MLAIATLKQLTFVLLELTRADGFDHKLVFSDLKDIDYKSGDVCRVLVQYPGKFWIMGSSLRMLVRLGLRLL